MPTDPMTLPDAQQQELDRIMDVARDWVYADKREYAASDKAEALRAALLGVLEQRDALKAENAEATAIMLDSVRVLARSVMLESDLAAVQQRLTIAEAATQEARTEAEAKRNALYRLAMDDYLRDTRMGYDVAPIRPMLPWESVSQKEGNQG